MQRLMERYVRGEPNKILYVKNIAKNVRLNDLFAVFGVILSLDQIR